MTSQYIKGMRFAPGFLGRAVQALSRVVQAGDQVVLRAGTQMREAILHPLKPFPLADVAGGIGAAYASPAMSPHDALLIEDEPLPGGIAGLPQVTLQNAHRFLTLLPTWLPMPQTRRHGPGQIALEWSGNGARSFSVLIGQDGMLIYSARLGPKGRLDGAEPISNQLSPIVTHVIRQLQG